MTVSSLNPQRRSNENDSAQVIRPCAIFWDMDGTLTDSEPLWEQGVYHISELMGRRATPEVREATVGGTVTDTLNILARWAGISLTSNQVELYTHELFDYVSGLYASNTKLFPGVADLLTELFHDGARMWITTNTQRKVADPVFDAIGRQYFVGTICGDEVSNGKPSPDIYVEAARRAGCEPSQCLVFEDSQAGMQAAASAGCVVVGLPGDKLSSVPQGVARIFDLCGKEHLDGVSKEDAYQWFRQLRRR